MCLFLNLSSIVKTFKKKMTPTADEFLSLRTWKWLVRYISKKSRFREPFNMWHGERVETLFKAERQHLYHIFGSLLKHSSWKTFLLLICKVLGLFVNPLAANDKHSLLKRGNLLQHFEMQLSQKWKRFSVIFFAFSEFKSNFNVIRKKDDPDS